MKKIILFMLTLCIIGAFGGCSNSTAQDSLITVSAGGSDVICSNSSYAEYISKNKELAHVPENSPIVISLSGAAPDTITVEDALLDDNGNVKKGQDAVATKTLEVKDGQCILPLAKKLAAMTSSNSEDYGKGKSLRGFHITYEIDHKEYSSTFVVRTDT